VVKVGLVAKTSEPEPVSSLTLPARSAELKADSLAAGIELSASLEPSMPAAASTFALTIFETEGIPEASYFTTLSAFARIVRSEAAGSISVIVFAVALMLLFWKESVLVSVTTLS